MYPCDVRAQMTLDDFLPSWQTSIDGWVGDVMVVCLTLRLQKSGTVARRRGERVLTVGFDPLCRCCGKFKITHAHAFHSNHLTPGQVCLHTLDNIRLNLPIGLSIGWGIGCRYLLPTAVKEAEIVHRYIFL